MADGDLNTVSVEQDGRTLTGVGADAGQLEAVMERHAPVETPAPPAAVSTEPPAPEAPKLKGRERYAQLTAERETARKEAEDAKREAADLKAKLEAGERSRQTPAPAPAAEPARPTAPVAAEKFSFPTFEQYLVSHPDESYDDWRDAKEDAKLDWRDARKAAPPLDIDAKIRASIEADRASRAFWDKVEAVRLRARAAYADFDAVLTNGPGSHINIARDEHSASQRTLAIVNHPQSEHLQYAIAKDAALAHRLAAMSDIEFGAELTRLAPGSAAAAPASTAVSGSVAPPPYQPVGAGSSTTVTPSADLPKRGFDFDRSGYREKRAAERGLRRMK